MHDAFRVARGEKIISNTGQPVQLIRPLDFLAITEHAEFLGIATALKRSDPRLLGNEAGRRIYDQFNAGQEGRMAAFADIIEMATVEGIDPFAELGLADSIWDELLPVIDEYNNAIPLGRLEEPEDTAKLALFLASEDAAYMTGQAINVAGGMEMAV